jgi:hypothetical protein
VITQEAELKYERDGGGRLVRETRRGHARRVMLLNGACRVWDVFETSKWTATKIIDQVRRRKK